MMLAIVVFGAAFAIGLAVGTFTRRPFATASFVTACFAALVAGAATGPAGAGTAFGVVFLAGLVIDSVRETVGLLFGRG